MSRPSSLATAARRRLQQQRQQRQDEGQEPSREPYPSSGMLSGDRLKLGVLIVLEGSNVEDIHEAHAGIQSVLGALSSTAQRPAWLHGLDDVMAA